MLLDMHQCGALDLKTRWRAESHRHGKVYGMDCGGRTVIAFATLTMLGDTANVTDVPRRRAMSAPAARGRTDAARGRDRLFRRSSSAGLDRGRITEVDIEDFVKSREGKPSQPAFPIYRHCRKSA